MAKRKSNNLVNIHFYHPDSRINFFSAKSIFESLLKQKKIRFYINQSSGNDWQGNYSNLHTVQVYEDQEEIVWETLIIKGYACIG